MPEIRHMAIVVSDMDRAAKFYADAFQMAEVEREYTPTGDGCYLSDGELNLALLNYKSDEMAGITNSGKYIGAHHFGIQVEDLDEAQKRIEAAGGSFHFNLGSEKTGNFESKFRDPNGVIFDISQGGWIGTPTRRLQHGNDKMPPRGRTGVSMLRHIAIAVPDPEKSASFYEKVFGFKRVGDTHSPLGDGVYVTDGYVNLACLRYTSDDAAGVERGGKSYVGTHHFGFKVPSLDDAGATIKDQGGRFFLDLPVEKESLFYESKYRDPDGIIFDISQNGWATAPQ